MITEPRNLANLNGIVNRHADGWLSYTPTREGGPFTFQGTASKTFKSPEGVTEGKLPLPAIWDFYYNNSPNHPLWIWDTYETDANGEKKTQTVTWGQAVPATYRAVRLVNDHLARLNIPTSRESPDANPVIGILALTDTPTFWAVMTGIMRAGNTVFLISPRNSPAALAHLFLATGTSAFFASGDPSMQGLAKAALGILKQKQVEGEAKLKGINIDNMMLRLPPFDEFYDLGPEPRKDFEVPPPFDTSDAMLYRQCMVAHSSGSTSYPKPIPATWKSFTNWTLMTHHGDVDFCGRVVSAHSAPLFHIMGVAAAVAFPSGAGVVCAVFNPKPPPGHVAGPPNPISALEAIKATKCDVIFAIPAFFEAWSQSAEATKALAQLSIAYFGGGPMQKGAGDKLVDAGVNLKSFYGATEFGSPFTHTLTKSTKDDWEYFRFSSQFKMYLKPQHDTNETYELLVVEPPPDITRIFVPCVINSEFEGARAYATNDLLQQHPTDPSLWRVYGRGDDQIMHSTGEKTNPGPLEDIISKHPSVQACLMFGRGEHQPGLLVEPVPAKTFDPKDEEKLVSFRNEIWPRIEEANAFAPKHSRIFKEMIIVTDPSRPMQLTAKRTIRRQIMLNEYTAEIAAAYKAVEEVSERGIDVPTGWSTDECTGYVRNVVKKILRGKEISDDDDFFQIGADSLQATAIRNTIVYALRSTKRSSEAQHVSQTLIYDNPTISSLSEYLFLLTSGEDPASLSKGSTPEYMRNLVKELTNNFPKHAPRASANTNNDSEFILVTGTTGTLGTYILTTLVSLPSVKTIFALNRPDKSGSVPLKERQLAALRKQGVPVEILESEKIVFLEGDTSLPNLGLEENVLQKITESLTSIIHNAWRVDFNISLPSFKPQLVGLRHILDLALRSPHKQPRVIFTSSVGTVQGWKGPGSVPEEALPNPELALQAGYGQSKWVAEQVLDVAGRTTPLQAVVVRVGQLSGSRLNGSWNPWEWFPALVQSAKISGVDCLPNAQGVVSWVPIDIAATVLVEMRNAPIVLESEQSLFLHLAHPQPVPMRSVMGPIASALDVPLLTFKEWLIKLERVATEKPDAINVYPALRLIEFYRALRSAEEGEMLPEAESYIRTRLCVDISSKASPTLGSPHLNPIGKTDVTKWLAFWGLV